MPSVLTRSNPPEPLSNNPNPTGISVGVPALVLFIGLLLTSEIKPMYVRGLSLARERSINRKNTFPVSLSSIVLVIPLNPTPRVDPELWPLNCRTLLPSLSSMLTFPVSSPWVSQVPPNTPVHALSSGLPGSILSKFSTNSNSAWTAVLASSITKTTNIFLTNRFIIKPFQNRYQ